jgi:hypothetical protein
VENSQGYGERNRDAILRLAHSKGKQFKRIAPSISPGSRHDFWLYGNLTQYNTEIELKTISTFDQNIFSFKRKDATRHFNCPHFGWKQFKIPKKTLIKIHNLYGDVTIIRSLWHITRRLIKTQNKVHHVWTFSGFIDCPTCVRNLEWIPDVTRRSSTPPKVFP